jgi:hypothetical protein
VARPDSIWQKNPSARTEGIHTNISIQEDNWKNDGERQLKKESAPGWTTPDMRVQHFMEAATRFGYCNATPEENAEVGLAGMAGAQPRRP